MSNELIRELVEALEYSSDFLSRSASRFDDVIETLAKARAYLETGGWTRVEDGLPVVPEDVHRIAVWVWLARLPRPMRIHVSTDNFPPAITHWRYAESTPESPKG